MPRKHLFAVVVLLGAALVAALLAVSRGGAVGATAAPASSAEIAARERSLDQLEASLRRSLAEQPPAVSAAGTAAQSAPARTVFVHAPQPAQPTGDDDEHEEHEHDHEGDDD
ncbi:MAG TPA: hypothetical protein VIA10_12090 [Gaiellaceae bacterium]|jgi:hypothetical protein